VVTSDREDREVQAANDAGSQPVVFIHGLWVLAESWRPWADLFKERGYAPVAVDWPGDPASVDEARRNPGAFAGAGAVKVERPTGRTSLTATSAGAPPKAPKPRRDIQRGTEMTHVVACGPESAWGRCARGPVEAWSGIDDLRPRPGAAQAMAGREE